MALCGGGGGSTSTNTVNSSGAPDWYKSALQGIASRGEPISQEGYTPYGGNRIAPFTGDTLSSFDATRANVGSWQPATDQARSLATAAGTPFPMADIGAYMNPYWSQVAQRAESETVRQDDIARQSRNAAAVGAGSFGGSRHGLIEAEANRDLQQRLSDIYLRGGAEAFDRGQSAFFKDQENLNSTAKTLAGLGQQYSSLGMTDAAALGSIGTQQQQQNQANADLAYQNFTEQRDWPKGQLGWYQNLLTGISPSTFGGTSTTTQTQPSASTLGQLAGLGLTVAGIGGRNGFGWWGLKEGGPVRSYSKGGAVQKFQDGGAAVLSSPFGHLSGAALRIERLRALSQGDVARAQNIDRELTQRAQARAVPPSTLAQVTPPAPNLDGGESPPFTRGTTLAQNPEPRTPQEDPVTGFRPMQQPAMAPQGPPPNMPSGSQMLRDIGRAASAAADGLGSLGDIEVRTPNLGPTVQRGLDYVARPANEYQDMYGPQRDEPGYGLRRQPGSPAQAPAQAPAQTLGGHQDLEGPPDPFSLPATPAQRSRASLGGGGGGGGAPGASLGQPAVPPQAASPQREQARATLEDQSRRAGDVGSALLYAGLAMMQAASQPGATLLGSAGAGGIAAMENARATRRDRTTEQYRLDQAENMRQQRALQERQIGREEIRDQNQLRENELNRQNQLRIAQTYRAGAGGGQSIAQEEALLRRAHPDWSDQRIAETLFNARRSQPQAIEQRGEAAQMSQLRQGLVAWANQFQQENQRAPTAAELEAQAQVLRRVLGIEQGGTLPAQPSAVIRYDNQGRRIQ